MNCYMLFKLTEKLHLEMFIGPSISVPNRFVSKCAPKSFLAQSVPPTL